MTDYFSSDFEPFGVFEFSDQDPITMRIYDSLREDLGPAFQQPDQDAETFADAMCLGISQLQLEGAAAQDDPDQINGLLVEVEKDYGIIPYYGATLNERREALKMAMTAALGALTPVIFNGLTSILGSDFIFWRPTDFRTEVDLETLTPTFVSLLTPIRVVTINERIYPGTRTVTYLRDFDDGNPLQNGDRLMVDVRLPGITEPVIVSSSNKSGSIYSFTATFAKPHDPGTRGTTAPQPRWVSSKCHSIVVVTLAALFDHTKLSEIHAFMRKAMPASSTWAICNETSSGKVAPFLVGAGYIGHTPIAAAAVDTEL